jgi:hypothetical protein
MVTHWAHDPKLEVRILPPPYIFLGSLGGMVDTVDLKSTLGFLGIGSSPIVSKRRGGVNGNSLGS